MKYTELFGRLIEKSLRCVLAYGDQTVAVFSMIPDLWQLNLIMLYFRFQIYLCLIHPIQLIINHYMSKQIKKDLHYYSFFFKTNTWKLNFRDHLKRCKSAPRKCMHTMYTGDAIIFRRRFYSESRHEPLRTSNIFQKLKTSFSKLYIIKKVHLQTT